MRTWGKKSIVVAGSVVMAVVLTSCGMGKTLTADQMTLDSVRLNGEVSNTEVGETTYYFEYGLTPEYGSTTPVGSLYASQPNVGYPVSATVSGLAEGTDYYYRICAHRLDGKGSCGANGRVRTDTTVTWDAVNGAGYVIDDTTTGLKIGGTVRTRESYDPEYGYGDVQTDPGPSSSTQYYGDATCLTVQGNRASMGFADWSQASYPDPRYFIVFVEDNGPTGDRWGRIEVDEMPTTCPVPTGADFPSFVVGSQVIPPIVTIGDFVVHDNLATP